MRGLVNRSPVAPPPTRYGGAIIQNRSAGGNPPLGRVAPPPTKFGPATQPSVQAKPAAPGNVVQPVALAVGSLAAAGVYYLWSRSSAPPDRPTRVRMAIASAPYANMQNLNAQVILAGGTQVVKALAGLFVANKQRYAASCLTQFKAVLDDFEMTQRGNWQDALRTAFIENAPMPEVQTMAPAYLAGNTKNLIDEVRRRYIARNFSTFSGTLLTSAIGTRLRAMRKEFGDTLYYLGVSRQEADTAKQSVAGRLLHHHWPFIRDTTGLSTLAATRPSACVDELFAQIVDHSGYQYDAGTNLLSELHISGKGNCRALANDFGFLLSLFGIDSELETLEPELDRRRFIVRCPNFVDPAVRGNIYLGGQLLPSFYVFQSHYALKVGHKIYDVMAGAKYNRLAKVATLILLKHYKPSDTVQVFRQDGNGEIMNGKNRLVIDYGAQVPGKLPRCELYTQGDACQALGRRVP